MKLETFSQSLSTDFLEARTLMKHTGRRSDEFASVVVKELLDNAFDAAETARRAPEIYLRVDQIHGASRITVADNGNGIPVDIVRRILDFSSRTSSKAFYRVPMRGAQGNAWKTILGIPPALGGPDPIVIEAQGVRHIIRASVDAAQNVRVEHDTHSEQPLETQGTRITVTVPSRGGDAMGRYWADRFALFNPHALVKTEGDARGTYHAYAVPNGDSHFYKPTVDFAGGAWRKFCPGDLHSPHWYSAETLYSLIISYVNSDKATGRSRTLREFLVGFEGMKGTAKTKAIGDKMPDIRRLSDFDGCPHRAEELLTYLREEARAPRPRVLGEIGEAHFVARFRELYGTVKRHWYRRIEIVHDGVPYVFEAIVADVGAPGDIYHAVNYSPTFEDPLARINLHTKHLAANGIDGFLRAGDCHPHHAYQIRNVVAAAHLSCPATLFLDAGKFTVTLPETVADAIAEAMWSVVKVRHKEAKQRERDASAHERQQRERERENESRETLREIVFRVLPAAIEKGTGGGALPISARSLYYQVRPLMQEHTDRELDYTYFSQALLPEYQRQQGNIQGLYYDPRGTLYEPHAGANVPLGTREVEAYTMPSHRFDKVLLVEKKGLWPLLKSARLGEKYDMAIVASEGYASEATRNLFSWMSRERDVQLFVLHDADPAGYNIARTLQEETARMPGYRVDVIDLGLFVADAMAWGLAPEEFTRRKALPKELRLTAQEREFFEGRCIYDYGKKQWVARRIELNAFTGPDLIKYIEEKLEAAGVRPKLIPPGATLTEKAGEIVGEMLDAAARDAIRDQLDYIVNAVRDSIKPPGAGDIRDAIGNAFAEDPFQSWNDALSAMLTKRIDAEKQQIRDTAFDAMRQIFLETFRA